MKKRESVFFRKKQRKIIGGEGEDNNTKSIVSIFAYILVVLLILVMIILWLLSVFLSNPTKINNATNIIYPMFLSIIMLIAIISMFTDKIIVQPYNTHILLFLFSFVILSNIIRLFLIPNPTIEIPFYDFFNNFYKEISKVVIDKDTQSQMTDAQNKVNNEI
jgi:hypothetical protein